MCSSVVPDSKVSNVQVIMYSLQEPYWGMEAAVPKIAVVPVLLELVGKRHKQPNSHLNDNGKRCRVLGEGQ